MSHSDKIPTSSPESIKHDSASCASPSSYLGLSQSIPESVSPKSVSIAPTVQTISPLILGRQKSADNLQTPGGTPKKASSKSVRSHRLSGKPPLSSSPNLKPQVSAFDGTVASMEDADASEAHETDHFEQLVDQISSWIHEKRAKRSLRRAARHGRSETPQDESEQNGADSAASPQRRPSDASDDSVDLEKLERIVKQNLTIRQSSTRRAMSLRSRPSVRKMFRKQSASATDTESLDPDVHVPSCDVVLDNSRTLAYSGGVSDLSDNDDDADGDELQRMASHRDVDAWAKFRFEIVRLSHTLRIKGWRKVPLERSAAIAVQRLSGALTNAVYVVSPPSDLPLEKYDENGTLIGQRKPPPKLLLRIYGPQVEHLIDRGAELAILKRLARKRIGPRLLGTFANGRFEEYFHAKALTPEDLRDADTSRQIAKRMRELHDGVELLDQERHDGPFVWRNWDKWLNRAEQIVTWMDNQVKGLSPDEKPTGPRAWLRRGYICGVPWKEFRTVVEKYRDWLNSQYGGTKHLQEALVFAHNDTQYGNILRQVPTGDSPLLLPANSHKQLIVIDFEYASANTPGLEFANHFTEWCYNYHDEKKPYAMHPGLYPKPEEQERFIRAYVRHRPEFNVSTPKLAPMTPQQEESRPDMTKRSTTSISDFMLDARTPSQSSLQVLKEDAAEKVAEDAEVKRLMDETRLWRLANTAMWVAWGIVQAKVPCMPFFDGSSATSESEGEIADELLGERAEQYKELVREQQGDEPMEEDEEFDYLGYAQHRAMFFWGDAVQMGLVKLEDLPEDVRMKIKTVQH